MNLVNIIHTLAALILPLLLAITLHEAAHGWVANRCGDRTALMMGRVTLNPAPHIDLFGTILLPIIMFFVTQGAALFGWAKPVPVTWENLRHPRRDMVWVALAGPAANLVMAFAWGVIGKLMLMLYMQNLPYNFIQTLCTFLLTASSFGIYINCILLVLNLLPLPPLDGSRVVSALLPRRLSYHYDRIEPYGIWILLALLVFGVLFHIIAPPVMFLRAMIHKMIGLPFI